MSPLVSVIIPTYNRPSLLEAVLETVLKQEYEHWECLVIDDGSDEEMKGQVKKFCSKDSRIKFFSRPIRCRKGASSCRNYGLSQAKGELIQFLDDDDLLDKSKLAKQVKLYTGANQYTLFTCQWGGFTDPKDLKSRFKFQYHSYRDFKKGARLLNTFGLYNEYFPLHVYLTPRSLIERAGPWNEELTNNDDAEYFTRIILSANNIKYIPEAKVHYRYGNSEKLSEVNSKVKVSSFLESLRLIDNHIKKFNRFNPKYYTRRSKSNIYTYLKKNHPNILSHFETSLCDRRTYNNLYYRFLKKLGRKFIIRKN